MHSGSDFPLQLQLRPSRLAGGPDVPCPLLERQLRFQNNRVLRPSNGHGLGQHFRHTLIGAVKLPHPPEISGGEAGGVRICGAQIFRSGNGCAFLWPVADQPANPAVQVHLRQIRRHQGVQRREHGAVINWFPDVQNFSPFHQAFLNPNDKENRELP